MKRILTLATTGLFVTGLALLPMTSRADETVTGGKTPTSTQAGKDAATTGMQHSTTPAKSDEKTTTVAPASGGAVAKTPAKNPS